MESTGNVTVLDVMGEFSDFSFIDNYFNYKCADGNHIFEIHFQANVQRVREEGV